MNLLLVGSWGYNQVHHLAVKFNTLFSPSTRSLEEWITGLTVNKELARRAYERAVKSGQVEEHEMQRP